MDKLSIKVLRYLKKQSEPIPKDAIIKEFGSRAAESIRYLEGAEYIKSGKSFVPYLNNNGSRASFVSNGKYEIASLGLDFLQSRPGKIFDGWLSRLSVIFSILGGALLSKPLWKIIEWLEDWITNLF